MVPLINGKDLMDCSLEDIRIMLDNPDYRESEYLDFKRNFAFLEMEKGKQRDEKVSEFRSDVCAFANSDGGYLIFGIGEEKGVAHEMIGIDIPDDNIDKFELDRKNNLNSISPQIPPVQFKFLKMEAGKYIVIIHVQHDFFAPYIHLEGESNYKIFRRVGNGKKSVSYMEMRNMFTQSLSLEKEIEYFRRDRIQYFLEQEDTNDHRYSRFLLLHIIPETFLNSTYDKNLFLMEKRENVKFGSIFSAARCNSFYQPSVDGIRSVNTESGTECLLFNNGISELYFPLESNYVVDVFSEKHPNGILSFDSLRDSWPEFIMAYFSLFPQHYKANRYFVCASVIGCKGVTSLPSRISLAMPIVDRNTIICPPTVFWSNRGEEDKNMKMFELNCALALGIRASDIIDPLIKDVYLND